MKNLSILIALILISGCASQKRCWNKFPPEVKIERVVTDTTIYSDTIIYFQLPSDTVIETRIDTILATKRGKPYTWASDTLKVESKLSIGYTWITLNRSTIQRSLKLVDKDTTLIIKLENAIRERDRLEQIIETKIFTPEPEKFIPWYMVVLLLLAGFTIGYVFRIIHKLIK